MRELSLFTGAGGGLLGTMLLGWEPVGYVENNEYCQRVIAARIQDGYLPEAPIFGDIKAFNRDGYAESYQGLVDVLSAGFPCTPFSVAGKRQGADDERNMWPATLETIRIVRPKRILLENVPGLVADPYWGTILKDLSKRGFSGPWACIPAACFGAPFVGNRVYLVASANSRNGEARVGAQRFIGKIPQGNSRAVHKDWVDTITRNAGGYSRRPYRMDRLKALGGFQVPAVVAAIWRLLNGG